MKKINGTWTLDVTDIIMNYCQFLEIIMVWWLCEKKNYLLGIPQKYRRNKIPWICFKITQGRRTAWGAKSSSYQYQSHRIAELFLPSVQFSRSIMSDFLQPHGLQHPRLPCPSTTPRGCSNSYSSSWWCYLFTEHLLNSRYSASIHIAEEATA